MGQLQVQAVAQTVYLSSITDATAFRDFRNSLLGRRIGVYDNNWQSYIDRSCLINIKIILKSKFGEENIDHWSNDTFLEKMKEVLRELMEDSKKSSSEDIIQEAQRLTFTPDGTDLTPLLTFARSVQALDERLTYSSDLSTCEKSTKRKLLFMTVVKKLGTFNGKPSIHQALRNYLLPNRTPINGHRPNLKQFWIMIRHAQGVDARVT